MRERLFKVIHKLEETGWRWDSRLVKTLREIAEMESPEVIEEILEAFK